MGKLQTFLNFLSEDMRLSGVDDYLVSLVVINEVGAGSFGRERCAT